MFLINIFIEEWAQVVHQTVHETVKDLHLDLQNDSEPID